MLHYVKKEEPNNVELNRKKLILRQGHLLIIENAKWFSAQEIPVNSTILKM